MSSMAEQCEKYRGRLTIESFATIVPGRCPVVKLHKGLHLAKRAVGDAAVYLPDQIGRSHYGARGGEIYQYTADGWTLLYRVEHGALVEELPWIAGVPADG
ncbi:hypothetical protein [Streptomyces malaysiensis]